MVLYHATACAEPLQQIQPRINTTVAGVRGAFVFATEDLRSAHCYALKTPDMRACFTLAGLPATVIENREKFLDEKPEGRIYILERTGFQQVHVIDEPTEEWISKNPVSVDPDKIIEVDIEKALATSAQFFFIQPGRLTECMSVLRRADHTDGFQKLGELLHAGYITYENEQRGLNTYVVPRAPGYIPPSW